MQRLDERQLICVSDLLYEAAAVAERWPEALTAAARLLGADTAHYVVWDKRRCTANFAVTASHDVRLSAQYATEWGPRDPCRAFMELNPGCRWVLNSEVMNRDAFERHPYNNEFLIPSGFKFVAKSQVHRAQQSDTYNVFGFVRTEKHGHFDRTWADLTESVLGASLRGAARLHSKMSETGLRGRLSEAAIDVVQAGAVLVSRTGHVLFANRSAEATFRQAHRGLTVTNGYLRARDQGLNAKLREVLHEGHGMTLRVPSECGGEIMLSIAPVQKNVDVSIAGGDQCMIVLISDPSASNADDAIIRGLRDIFDLTPGEARTAMLIGSGIEPTALAEAEGRSYETIRTVLKRVFSKAGISRQNELVAVVERLKSIVPKNLA